MSTAETRRVTEAPPAPEPVVWQSAQDVYISMGYRQMSPAVPIWAKPLGFTILVIDLRAEPKIRQQFYDRQGNLATWSSAHLNVRDLDELESQIKTFEEYSVHHGLSVQPRARLNFITQAEQYARLL